MSITRLGRSDRLDNDQFADGSRAIKCRSPNSPRAKTRPRLGWAAAIPVPQSRTVGHHRSGGADTSANLGAALGLWMGLGGPIVPSRSIRWTLALPMVSWATVDGVPILRDSVRGAAGPE